MCYIIVTWWSGPIFLQCLDAVGSVIGLTKTCPWYDL